ncbi:facilitated trehalose transporter Tret1-like isoform X2 [Planococcus citri]|uniref:facilitated trehalose transporter Tret1-like isoform X2 n=1 Tax=Planococcus citri TaxID=170843 RepID=UPI0031F9F350
MILCAIIIGISMIHAGLTIAFSNLLNRHFSDQTIANFASLSALTTPVGSCLISATADRFGRRRNLLLIQVGCVVTWTAMSAIEGELTLYLGAVLCGLSRGALTATCPGYISEITYSQYRQLFLSLTTTFFTLGVFIVSFLHAFTTYVHAALFLSGCFVALTVLTYLVVPESPHWLAVIKLDSTTAKRNLKKLNPNQSVFDNEWRLIEEKLNDVSTPRTAKVAKKLGLLKNTSVYRPCLTLLGLIFFQQFCFIYPFTSYTIRCLPALAPELGHRYEKHIFLATGVARMLAAIATSVALAAFNQKQLLLLSAAGMALSSFGLLITRLQLPVVDVSFVDWISLGAFLIYLLSGYVGLLGVPWTIIFELLPTEVKGLMGPVLVAVGYATMALVLKVFPPIYDQYTTQVFVYTTVISLCAVFYVSRFVVETKGKSLYEIENFYAKKSHKNTNTATTTTTTTTVLINTNRSNDNNNKTNR